jgi:hypothetical protein
VELLKTPGRKRISPTKPGVLTRNASELRNDVSFSLEVRIAWSSLVCISLCFRLTYLRRRMFAQSTISMALFYKQRMTSTRPEGVQLHVHRPKDDFFKGPFHQVLHCPPQAKTLPASHESRSLQRQPNMERRIYQRETFPNHVWSRIYLQSPKMMNSSVAETRWNCLALLPQPRWTGSRHLWHPDLWI